jgi:hypothetical protein
LLYDCKFSSFFASGFGAVLSEGRRAGLGWANVMIGGFVYLYFEWVFSGFVGTKGGGTYGRCEVWW